MAFPSILLVTTLLGPSWCADANARAQGVPISGGAKTKAAFEGWLSIWRGQYKLNAGDVPDLPDTMLPDAFRGIPAKVVVSSGGAAGGVVTEGMGYAIMVEGFEAVKGNKEAETNGLALLRGWLGMVYGPEKTGHPFGGGNEQKESATDVAAWPYGVSAIESKQAGKAPSGVAGWKFPIDQCGGDCQGSATDGDEDAVLGMVYLAAALGNKGDFVDMVIRAVISFASADLGFPDLYRIVSNGTRVFVPKGGSQWGGLLPDDGKYKSTQGAGCYNPSYFAPAHYRTFRDFVASQWKDEFNAYLPPHLSGGVASMIELKSAFEGAVIAGYNLLERASCPSGTVANWVGSKSTCSTGDLSCAGVPWADTPFVGASGTCSASGTPWGAWGADASRTPWRIAMDYILYTEESTGVHMYNAAGEIDSSMEFGAQVYLNRIAEQYRTKAQCDGGKSACEQNGKIATYKLASAYDQDQVTCDNVPKSGDSWWSAFMSYPTFTAFVAPYDAIPTSESTSWLDTFASICDFSTGKPTGDICQTSYFEAGQEVISTMVMAGAVVPLTSSFPTRIVV